MASEQTNSVALSQNIDLASTFAPPPPHVGSAADDAGDILGSIAHGGVTDDRQPEFGGRGTPGDTIVIRDNGTEIGTTEVDANGNWTFTPSTDLLEGQHAITIVTRDSSGNEGTPSPAFNFEIDVTPPDASRLNVSGFTDNVGGVTGNVISGGTTDETRPLLSGISNGTPGHTVTVMVKDATGTHELGLATIGENGQWTFQVEAPLAAGLNTFMLVERDAAGNETMPTGRYKVTVNTDKPNAPVIDSVFDDVGEPHMLQQGEATNDARPMLAGTAQANHTVKFYDGSTYLGQAVADASGNWSFTPTVGLTDGTHGITATSTSPKGQTSGASNTWNFVVDTVAPKTPIKLLADGANVDVYFDATDAKAGDTVRVFFGDRQVDHVLTGADIAAGKVSLADAGQPSKAVIIDPAGNVSPARTPTAGATIDKVYDDQGSITGDLLPGAVTDDNQPDISGTSEANSTVLIKDHGVVIGQTQADASGHWTFKSPMLLADGAHSLTATAVGKDGIAGAPSEAFDFTVDAKAPLAPSIDSVFDNEGPDHGTVVSGSVTDDATPAISGKAEPNSTVVVYGNGVELGRAPVDGAGRWTFEPNPPLENGAYKLTAKAVDAAGNISVPSNDFNLVLDKDLSTGDDHPRELLEGGGNSNATLLIDTSPSMSGAPLASVQQTLKDLATAYLEVGESVTLTLLSMTSNIPVKYTFASATDADYLKYIAAVNALGPNGGIAYETTVLAAMNSIKADHLAGKGPSQVFILGDAENLLSQATADKWKAMLKDPDGDGNPLEMPIVSTPISFIPLDHPYAYSFEWLASDKAIGMPTPEMLPEILLGSAVADTISGNLLGNDVKITVDGKERLSQITFEGGVFRVTSDNKLVVENASGKVISAAYDASSGLLTVATANGWLKVYMQNSTGHKAGDYSYAAKFATLYNLESSVKEIYGYTVVDSKEASQTSKLHISIQQPSASELLKISSLGKDTGVAGDLATADGSAGRAITGTLSMPLASGLKVQVSIDGGKTWQDAVVNGKNWAFVDLSAHTSDWAYQVRVSDGVKHGADVLSREVTLVDVPGAPAIMRIPDAEGFYTYTKASDGSQVLLSLAGTGAKAGDTVHIQWGSTTYDQVLTQLDINSGIATVNVPSTATYSYQGYAKDFAVTAQIISKNGALGAVSKPYEVVVTAALTGSSDTLHKTPVGDVYTGTGFKVTTTGSLSYKAATTTTLAGLTLNDATQANALFTLDKPANYFTLRLTGIDNAMGAQIQVFDVKGNLIHTENFIGGTDARHTKVFTYTSAELVDIGSFKVISLSTSVTLDAFSQQVVNHVAETRDPNLIEYAPETFYGGTEDDVVSLSVSATTYFNQATAGIHGGSGIDTLKLEGYAHVLDLTKVGSKLSSMEVIDITGSHYNTLTLSLAEVLNNGGVDLFYQGDKSRVQMMVKGNAGDTVNLSDLLAGGIDQGDWVKKSSVTVQGVAYDSYQHSSLAAELLVQQGVTVKVTNSTLVGAVGTFEAPSDAMPDALPDDEVLSHSTQGYTHGDDTLIAKLGFADRLSGGTGNDTFTHVGTRDVVHGGAGDDTIRINSGDFERVEGGLGIDTLVMDGKAMHIDLTAFGLKIQGFEKFDLGAGGNTLALHASDVLAGGMRDMVTADGKVQMLVNGANGDVNLLGGNDSWTQGGNTTVGDVTYSVYTNLAGTAELLVEDKVHVTIL